MVPPPAASRTAETFRSRANIAASICSGAAKAAFSSTTRSAYPEATRRATPGRRWRISTSSARRTLPSFIPTRRSASTARSIAAATSQASCWPRRRWAWPRCRRRRWRFIPRWRASISVSAMTGRWYAAFHSDSPTAITRPTATAPRAQALRTRLRSSTNSAGKESPDRLSDRGFHFSGERYRSVDVAADVDGAQAHAVAGLNQLLLIAIADAGVDIEARADAPATVTPAPAAMKAVRGSGSGSQRNNAERSCGDQSEGNLAKHYLSPVKLARCRCCVPARLSQRPLRAFNGALNYCVSGVFRAGGGDMGGASGANSVEPLEQSV